MMYQQEIQFFWPLTEQIPLDLEYAPTHIYYRAQGVSGVNAVPIQGSIYEFIQPLTMNSTYTTSINIDSTNVIIKSSKLPPLYRRLLFKLLGIKWEQS